MGKHKFRRLRIRPGYRVQEGVYGRMDWPGRHPSSRSHQGRPYASHTGSAKPGSKDCHMNASRNVLSTIRARLKKGEPISVELPASGILNIDQPVPFLLVYRFPQDGKDYFTYQLGMTESSYIMAHDDEGGSLSELLQGLINEMSQAFGSFLLLEVWVGTRENETDFTIYINHKSTEAVAQTLKRELQRNIGYVQVTASVHETDHIAPPGFKELIARSDAKQIGCQMVGLEIKPIYIDFQTRKPYPLFARELRKMFGKALKKAFFEFIRLHTSFTPSHFEILGPPPLV